LADLNVDMKVKLIVDKLKNLEGLNTGFKKIEQSAEKTAKSTKKSISKIVGSFGPLTALLGGTAVIAGFTKIIKTASDAEEAFGKFAVVFGEVEKNADKAAKNLNDKFGVSLLEAKKLLGDTGDLLTGFGFGAEQALELSDGVQQLAVDLASFSNFSGGAAGASAALTKALLGEREGVKALGISIQEADVKAKVLENTQKGLTFETERQAKAFATLQIAQEQSKNAIGDFARTSGSFANQLKILRSEFADIARTLGNVFLPAFRGLLSLFNLIPGPIKIASIAIGGLSVAFLALRVAILKANLGLRATRGALIGTGIGAAVVLIGTLVDKFFQLRKETTSAANVFKSLNLKIQIAMIKINKSITDFLITPLKKIPFFGDKLAENIQQSADTAAASIPQLKKELEALSTATTAGVTATPGTQTPTSLPASVQEVPIKLKPVIETSKLADEISSKISGAKSQLSSAVSGLDLTSELGRSTAEAAINATSEIINAVSAQLEANGFTPEEIQTRLSDLRNSISDINQDIVAGEAALSENQKFIANELTNGFSDFISTALEGTGNLKDSFLGAIGSIAKTIQDKIINELVGSLVSSAFGAISTGGIIRNNAVKNLPAFKDGGGNFGQFSGRGTGTSDSILARVSNGEFITDAATTSFFGSGFFKQLKNISRGRAEVDSLANFIGKKAPGFANGGLIGGLNDFSYSLRHFDLPKFNTGGEVSAQGGGTINANLPINVNIVNNGSEKTVRTKGPTFDQKGATISIIMEDLRNNGDVSKALQGVFGVRRGG